MVRAYKYVYVLAEEKCDALLINTLIFYQNAFQRKYPATMKEDRERPKR